VDWDEEAAEKAGYETFMLKEIHEQPTSLADTLSERVSPDGRVVLDGLGLDPEAIRGIRQVIIVACGTSYHAGLVGKYALERWARMPVEVEVASEFRYRDPVIGPDCLCIAISQSGETADTLAAMRLARQAGAHVLAVTNIVGSQATREADGVLFTRAGLEIGVAATKTFLTQVLAMLMLSLYFADQRGHLSATEVREFTEELRHIPATLRDYLEDGAAAKVEEVAKKYAASRFFLCLGRNMSLPVALEGALKLKEISYIPTDAYAAGEMKHGPIALLEEGSPVLVVATDSRVYDKLVSNVQEVRARGARVIAVGTEGNTSLAEMADEVLSVPRTDEMLAPLLSIVPLQLFAYYVAKHKGEKVDQPRNLAKTVTVE
jgi:glucosamine--fructose-6-phosphate aminotransferase (isomerizing)